MGSVLLAEGTQWVANKGRLQIPLEFWDFYSELVEEILRLSFVFMRAICADIKTIVFIIGMNLVHAILPII